MNYTDINLRFFVLRKKIWGFLPKKIGVNCYQKKKAWVKYVTIDKIRDFSCHKKNWDHKKKKLG